MTGDGAAGRRAELAALKAAVYGPHPSPEAIARLAELTDVPAPPEPVPAPAPAGRPRRRAVALPLAVLAALAVLAVAALAIRPAAPPAPRASADAPRPVVPAPRADAARAGALPAAQAALRQVVLDHPEELSARDWFTVYPELLPGTWRSVRVVTAHPGLVGPEVLPIPLAPATTRVLVFLVCSAPDTPYRWTLTTGPAPPLADTTGGRCRGFDGRIVGVPRGTDGLILRVRIAPGVHYSVTVYER